MPKGGGRDPGHGTPPASSKQHPEGGGTAGEGSRYEPRRQGADVHTTETEEGLLTAYITVGNQVGATGPLEDEGRDPLTRVRQVWISGGGGCAASPIAHWFISTADPGNRHLPFC